MGILMGVVMGIAIGITTIVIALRIRDERADKRYLVAQKEKEEKEAKEG